MDLVTFELCARRPEDLATLELLACALEEAGSSTRLAALFESKGMRTERRASRGPEPCEIRLGIADPATRIPLPADAALALALIEDRIEASPVTDDRPDLEQVQLLLVAGPARERELSARLGATVLACGLARLDRLETSSPVASSELLTPGPALPHYLEALLALRREVAPEPVEPSSEASVFAEVEAAVAFGDGERAIRKLEAYLLHFDSVAGQRLLARIERGAGRTERATRALDHATQLGRQALAAVLCDRGRLLVDQDRIDEARELFQEAVSLDPKTAEGHLGLGSLLLHAGRPSDARGEFQAALDREPGAAAWCGLGLALGAEEHHSPALDAFEKALELDPDSLGALFGLVQSGFAVGRLEPASRALEGFLERHPGNLDLTFTLAGIRKELGRSESALRLLDRIDTFRADYPGCAELRRKLEGTRLA